MDIDTMIKQLIEYRKRFGNIEVKGCFQLSDTEIKVNQMEETLKCPYCNSGNIFYNQYLDIFHCNNCYEIFFKQNNDFV